MSETIAKSQSPVEQRIVVPLEQFDRVFKDSISHALSLNKIISESFFHGVFYFLNTKHNETVPAYRLSELNSELKSLRAQVSNIELGLIHENPHFIRGKTIREPYFGKITHFSKQYPRKNKSFLRTTYTMEFQEVDARQELNSYLDGLIQDTEF